jgi:hypothetical protein
VILKIAGTTKATLTNTGALELVNTITNYNNVATVGWGVPAIYANARATSQTASVGSVAAYTVGASDGTFEIGAQVLVTSSTTHSFSVQVLFTDETSTSQAPAMAVWDANTGTVVSSITNALGARPYYMIPMQIRCKASTSITITTSGTFTSVTYNVEGTIKQIA